MKTPSWPRKSDRGSTLMMVLMAVVIMCYMSAGILSHSWTSYKVAMRQQLVEETKLQAENEAELLYFKWKTQLLKGTISSADIASSLIADGDAVNYSAIGTTDHAAFFPDASGWKTSRALNFDYESRGLVGNTGYTGTVRYFSARTRASRYSPTLGYVQYNLGRRFQFSETSLFQFSVFYQGEMEIGSSSNMLIKGDMSANGDIYIGSATTATVTVADKVRYGPDSKYNGNQDPMLGTTLRKDHTGTSGQSPPVFDPTPGDGIVPDQITARRNQVQPMEKTENFLGGVDVATVIANFPDAYASGIQPLMSDEQKNAIRENNVYRSVIAPPPTDSGGAAIPEDPVVASRRMYARAAQGGLIIKIEGTTVTIKNPNDPVDPNHNYANDSEFSSVVPVSSVRQNMTDKREVEGGLPKVMKVTTIDIGALNTAIREKGLDGTFNGVIYAYDTTTSNGAIRLINGATTPNYNNKGFTVATDNGLYIQGDYNTTLTSGVSNRTALMGDAVTVLSQAWNDAKSDLPLLVRQANSGTGKPTDGSTLAVNNATTVVAAIISGNTPSGYDSPSGGVQNLVRFLENWYQQSQTVTLYGSIGQMFTSKYFNSPYKANGTINDVYQIPANRNLTFDTSLASNPPAGTPTTTSFNRGDYYIWH